MSTSFQEKSVWIQLIGTLLGVCIYAVLAGRMHAAGVVAVSAYMPILVAAVVLMIVLLIAGHAAAAIVSQPEERDERDRLIGWKAEARSSWLLAVGIIAAIAGVLFSIQAIWIAHTLLLSLAASTVLCYTLRLVYYRRGGLRASGS